MSHHVAAFYDRRSPFVRRVYGQAGLTGLAPPRARGLTGWGLLTASLSMTNWRRVRLEHAKWQMVAEFNRFFNLSIHSVSPAATWKGKCKGRGNCLQQVHLGVNEFFFCQMSFSLKDTAKKQLKTTEKRKAKERILRRRKAVGERLTGMRAAAVKNTLQNIIAQLKDSRATPQDLTLMPWQSVNPHS